MSKLTVADLIAKREQVEKKHNITKVLYLPSLEGSIVIKKPSMDISLEMVDIAQSNPVEASKKLIYECVIEPNLKDTGLHSAYGCVEPLDIVEKLFDLSEINAIAEELGEMSGISNQGAVVEEIKKQ